MSKVEKKLRSKNLLATSKGESWLMEGEHYDTSIYKGGIEDDHIPFLHRGVEILHIIPVQSLTNFTDKDPFSYRMAYNQCNQPLDVLISGRRCSSGCKYGI
jgi:hypothetical protein